MVNAQEWLDQNYPKEERNNITELRVRQKKLEGHLDLQDFVNLEFLDCSRNQLTSLDLSKNTKLEVVNIYDNRISCNEYARLSIFSHLVNLQKLDLGFNTDRQLQVSEERGSLEQMVQQRGRMSRRDDYFLWELTTNESEESYNNDFSGSLEVLKNCQKLKELSIDGQKNITGKLEDLPSNVETLSCEKTSFQKELERFGHSRNLEILRLNWKIERLENTIEEERAAHQDFMRVSEEWGKKQKQELLDRIKELETENKRLKELTPQELVKEVEELKKQLAQLTAQQQTAQIEIPPKDKDIKGFF